MNLIKTFKFILCDENYWPENSRNLGRCICATGLKKLFGITKDNISFTVATRNPKKKGWTKIKFLTHNPNAYNYYIRIKRRRVQVYRDLFWFRKDNDLPASFWIKPVDTPNNR